jgi:hypothetical protein
MVKVVLVCVTSFSVLEVSIWSAYKASASGCGSDGVFVP